MDLVLAHRRIAGADAAPAAENARVSALTWRTCLREVAFVHDDPAMAAADAEIVRGGDAYALLLEILCGLDSPMLGETQVLGQFRAFLSDVPSHAAGSDWLRRFGQTLIADARDVRELHLRHLGSRSYGSAVRKRVDASNCRRTAMIGAGLLASEIMPFLQGGDRMLDEWTRRGRLAAINKVAVCSERAALIVAAPVSAPVIAAVAARYSSLALVLDLRGDADTDIAKVSAPVVTLGGLFADVASARQRTDTQTSAARSAIATKSRSFHVRADVRPFGWDDLCA